MAAENFLTRKLGPLPAWGWAAAGAGVYLVYRLRKSQSAASTSSSTTGTAGSGNYGSDYQEPTASYTNPSGFSYSGPASGLTNPTIAGLLSPSPAFANVPGSPSSGTSAPATSSNYLPVSQQAALTDITKGIPVFQSGGSALDFAQQHGGSAVGIDPNAFYALSPSAQQINLASGLGYPLYTKAA